MSLVETGAVFHRNTSGVSREGDKRKRVFTDMRTQVWEVRRPKFHWHNLSMHEACVGNRLELAVVLVAAVSTLLEHEVHVGVRSHLHGMVRRVGPERNANISDAG